MSEEMREAITEILWCAGNSFPPSRHFFFCAAKTEIVYIKAIKVCARINRCPPSPLECLDQECFNFSVREI